MLFSIKGEIKMTQIKEQYLTGERALFHAADMEVQDCTFADGESPLKESRNIQLSNTTFKWKYPLWYSTNIRCEDTTLLDTARSGIWYTRHIMMENCLIQAPKTFRRSEDITLTNVQLPNAEETFWNCKDITLHHVSANGNYFGMNSENINITDFTLSGNYSFDGAKNIEIHHAKLLSKDAFWNCENVTVYDSLIIGEYLGWNSKNIRFVNCTIDSLQGMCYMDHVVLENCKLLNTTLAFEYSTVDADIISSVDSITNPYEGVIRAKEIKEIIMEKEYVDPLKTKIETESIPA